MCYKLYETSWLDMQHTAKLKQFQMDHGGEYLSHEFDTHLKACRTVHSLTIQDTPEENSVSECINCTFS